MSLEMNINESGNEYEPWSHGRTRGDGMENPLPSVSPIRAGILSVFPPGSTLGLDSRI